MKVLEMKDIIYMCMKKLLERENLEYVTLSMLYQEVASFTGRENNRNLQSEIRGRLQDYSSQYSSFKGKNLFYTKKVRSGFWKLYQENHKFIRYKNGKFLLTEDNWENININTTLESCYVEETNQDYVYKARITWELGKKKANIILNELEKIRREIEKIRGSKKILDGFGEAFEVFAISTLHNISYAMTIKKYIVYGDADGKIDAVYYHEKDNNVYIYQIKTNFIDDNVLSIMKNNYNLCFRGKVPEYGENLFHFIQTHHSYINNKRDVYQTISVNSKSSTNIQPEYIYQRFFEQLFLMKDSDHLVLSIDKEKKNEDGLSVSNCCVYDEKNFIFFMNGEKFINCLLNSLGFPNYSVNEKISPKELENFFYKNVRGNLKINSKMQETLKKEPENFFKYNNGISITGNVEDLNRKILIHDPIINNGQQSIINLLLTDGDISKVMVPIKICHEVDPNIIKNICRYTNDQKNVKEIDLLSENDFVRSIQKYIFQNGKFFLDIITSGTKSYHDNLKAIYESNSKIKLMDFIKLYFTVLNKNDLGKWKNSPNNCVAELEISQEFDKELSLKVCNSIKIYQDYIDELKKDKDNKKKIDDLKSADLAFKYLLCSESLGIQESYEIIDRINQKYFYEIPHQKSKLIDIYKSSSIIKKIEEELSLIKDEV